MNEPRETSANVLEYSQPAPEAVELRPRPKWVFVVLGLYALCLLAFLLAPAAAALLDAEWQGVAATAGYVVVLVTCGLGMALVPVRAKRQKPISRRSIWITIVASGLLFALLASGGMIATGEFARHEMTGTVLIVATTSVWLVWTILFGLLSRSADPTTFAGRLHKLVLSGSVLELLVAVPMHVIVRRRTDCCAGLETGVGICVGVTVMIVAFGPAVLVLYWKRWKQLTGRR
jgi:hypothetical protein